MAWQLDIHTIDIGVGESSLVIANDPAVAGRRRSLLIDGGLDRYAQTVHNKIVAELPRGGPDTILVSHYDEDHSGGITNLLFADNLSMLVQAAVPAAITAATALAAMGAPTRPQIIAGVAAATAGALWGSWGPNVAAVNPVAAAAAAAGLAAGAITDAQAISIGVTAVANHGAFPSQTLVVQATKRQLAGRIVGIAAATSIATGHPAAVRDGNIRIALFSALASTVPPGARFFTGGRYRNTRIIDIGGVVAPRDRYPLAVLGGTLATPLGVSVPGLNRVRASVPAMGTEVLWAGAPGNVAPAAGAPAAVVVSGPDSGFMAPTGSAWQGTGQPVANFAGGTQANGVSIGLAIRFNDFFFFTAGDLPAQGEDTLYPALIAQPLPNANGGAFPAPPVPPPMAAFKCGHHGATTSTSPFFLTALQPRVAIISSGDKYGHPDQALINKLLAQVTIHRFYLTNCQYPRAGVPASTGGVQNGGGNKSRVAGDNNPMNLLAVHRGDIRIRVLQANSAGAGRQFTVDYWRWAPVPVGAAAGAVGGAPRTDNITW